MEREGTVLLLKHLSWRGRGLYYTLTPVMEMEGTITLQHLSWRGDCINSPTPVMEREGTVLHPNTYHREGGDCITLQRLSWRGDCIAM